MAIEALTGPQDYIDDNIGIYQWRRDRVVDALTNMGLQVAVPQASLYVWARVPEGYTSAGFAARLLADTDIVITPGSSYGQYGEGYVRFSYVNSVENLHEAVGRLKTFVERIT